MSVQAHSDPRVKKRLHCTLAHEARKSPGLVLNLSSRGLFVQTSLLAEPGTLVDIDLQGPQTSESIPLQAAVVWRRRVSPRMTGMNQSGMGVRILSHTAEYDALVDGILTGGTAAVGASTKPRSRAAAVDETPQHSYVIRLGMPGTPRSRRIVVQGATEQVARSEAAVRVGSEWTILEISKK
jgi:hypothetical protein